MQNRVCGGSASFLTDLVDRWAVERPDAPAVQCGDQLFSYRQLQERTNRLARALDERLPTGDASVGLCMDRSIDMIVAILAVWKLGRPYVGLDPLYPRDRLCWIVDDSAPALLCGSRDRLEWLGVSGIPCLAMDEISQASDSTALPFRITEEAIAYIMYTSGSSGTPKGVEITHANLREYLPALNERLRVTADDVYLHTASFSFSSSVRQLALPLFAGAKLVIAESEHTKDPLQLLGLLRARDVTVIDIIPSLWRAIIVALDPLEESERRQLLDNALRLIVSASEPLSTEIPRQWRRTGYSGRIVNMYGQTETTGIATTYELTDSALLEGATVPIGRPIASADILLLDEHLQLVDEGVPGEIFIGGTSVGRGYHNQPDLNEQSFLTLVSSGNRRYYKTGDLGSYGQDGQLLHLGRRDLQVKIRGCRVELAEIENVLNLHTGVKESVVLARTDMGEDPRLVAYCVANDEWALDAAALRNYLREAVPEYMIPWPIVQLPKVPRTPNGKIDRKALPHPNELQPRVETYVGRHSPIEAWLLKVWEKEFGVNSIGIRDNYFDLGGQSLMAVKLLSQVHKQFGVHCAPSVLLQHPTVEQLARCIEEQQSGAGQKTQYVVPLGGTITSDKCPLFIIHGALGNIVNFRPLAQRLSDVRPVYGIQAHGLAEGQKPKTSLEEMAALYLEEIRQVQPQGPYMLAGYCAGGNIALELARQLKCLGETVQRLVLIDTFSNLLPRVPSADERRAVHRLRREREGLSYLWIRFMNRISWEVRKCLDALGFQEANNDLERRSIAIHEGFKQAQQAYHQHSYSGKVLLVRPAIDYRYQLQSGNLDAQLAHVDPANGWSEFIPDLRVIEVEGDHDSQIMEPHVEQMALHIRLFLEEEAT